MLRLFVLVASSVVLTFAAAPIAHGQGDPHIPNGNVGWCPGGEYSEGISGGGRYCLGVQYGDGSFYGQQWVKTDPHNIFSGAWGWANYATCHFMVGGLLQGGKPYSTQLPQCGGTSSVNIP